MNKNFKVFQIHGLSGLLLLGFISMCLFFGFIVFPVWAVMTGWNQIVAHQFQGPIINYFQASLLWSIFIIFMYLTFRNSISIKVHTSNNEMNDKEIKEIMHEMEEMKENHSED